MKKLITLSMIACLFFLTGCYTHGRGGHHGGGRYFWGGMAAGAITGALMAPLLYPPENYYTPTCYDRVVRRGHYVRDYYGYRVWVPPIVVRECY